MRLPVAAAMALSILAGCVNAPTAVPDPSGAVTLAGYLLDCDVAHGAPTWTEPCLAFASPNDSPSKAEIDLAVNPTDPSNVVVGSKDMDLAASDCVWAVPQVSKDAGLTWTTSYIGGTLDERQPTDPLYGWQCITDPIMAFHDDGTLFYSLQLYDHTLEVADAPSLPLPGPVGLTSFGSAIYAARSTDGGLTWDKIVPLHVGDGQVAFHDFMRVVVSPATGTYHTVWNQFTASGVPEPVMVSWDGSSDRAREPVYLVDPAQPGARTMASFAAAKDGTLYVIIDGNDNAFLVVSTDDGASFSPYAEIDALRREDPIERQRLGDDSFRTVGAYELAVDNSGGARDGAIYATISDCPDDDCDLFVSRSDDGGATWSDRVLVNGGEHEPGVQWMARPVVDRLGNVHVVYLDTSRNVETNWLDASWAVSTDGGATWTNSYLTTQSFDGNLGIHQDGGSFIGDYLGIGTAGDLLYMGFPTTITGRAEIAVAKVHLPGS